MTSKFKFKLNALLKLREFNEKKVKMELGEIVKEIQSIENTILNLRDDIEKTYNAQEEVLGTKSQGQLVKFFPYYIEGKRDEIRNKQTLLFSLKKKYERKIEEMNKAMGETKVIENLKEKKYKEYKKTVERKRQEDIEENVTMGFHRRREKEL